MCNVEGSGECAREGDKVLSMWEHAKKRYGSEVDFEELKDDVVLQYRKQLLDGGGGV